MQGLSLLKVKPYNIWYFFEGYLLRIFTIATAMPLTTYRVGATFELKIISHPRSTIKIFTTFLNPLQLWNEINVVTILIPADCEAHRTFRRPLASMLASEHFVVILFAPTIACHWWIWHVNWTAQLIKLACLLEKTSLLPHSSISLGGGNRFVQKYSLHIRVDICSGTYHLSSEWSYTVFLCPRYLHISTRIVSWSQPRKRSACLLRSFFLSKV